MANGALRTAIIVIAAGLAGTAAAHGGGYRAPRNAFGQPDLEGYWTNLSLTVLQRPSSLKTLVVSDQEAAASETRRAAAPEADDGVGGQDTDWYDGGARLARIAGKARSSWIVDPPDGRLPYSAAGRAAMEAALKRVRTSFDGPETRTLGERCLLSTAGTDGPPMLNARYNSNYQIVQSPGAVAILVEMNHDVRIIHLGAKRHAPAAVRPWMGDSVGWWEGDTLVVETTNLNPGEALKANGPLYLSPAAKVTERFTRVSPTRILYQFTVNDPATYTRTWRAEMPLNAAKGPIYEYACHEGNYGVANALSGARYIERQADELAKAEAMPALPTSKR